MGLTGFPLSCSASITCRGADKRVRWRPVTENEEIAHAISRLQAEFEDLAVRGLRTAGTQHLAPLKAMREEFERIGAAHLAGRVARVITAIEAEDSGAASALLQARTSLRLFERVVSLEAAAEHLRALLPRDETESPHEPANEQ